MEAQAKASVPEAKASVTEVKPPAKPQAKRKKITAKVAKPISSGVNLFVTGNRRQGELNSATLRINGKAVSIPCMTSSKIDLLKLDEINPLISKLFTQLANVNPGYRIAYKNVSKFSLGLNPVSNHSHRCVVGHYHQDGAASLIVKPFVATNEVNLASLNKHGLTGAWIDPKGFIRLFVTSETDVKNIVKFTKSMV